MFCLVRAGHDGLREEPVEMDTQVRTHLMSHSHSLLNEMLLCKMHQSCHHLLDFTRPVTLLKDDIAIERDPSFSEPQSNTESLDIDLSSTFILMANFPA